MPLTGCGHQVAASAVGARDQAPLAEHIADPVKVAQETTASGGRAVALQGDVSLQADIERTLARPRPHSVPRRRW